jgi:hypothetical protein
MSALKSIPDDSHRYLSLRGMFDEIASFQRVMVAEQPTA